MTTSRRELLKAAALGGVCAGGLVGCADRKAEASAVQDAAITANSIAEAEKLSALSYTDAERALMLDGLEKNLGMLAALRGQAFRNDDAPALMFDPKLPGRSVKSQKNILNVLTDFSAARPAGEAEIAYASVGQQGAWLRSGEISSAELTEIYLRRIAALDKKLSAYVTITADSARQQASDADKDLAKGKDRGPLHGIPYGLKDLADTAGILTTWGAEPYRDRIPDTDSEVYKKLRSAGAVLLGKTSCGAIAYGDRWFGGRTRNPWNTDEGSSGSSAGSAAAVAAGLCSFGIGTETLGSIISPSERCGTVGLRPTFGRISRAGFMALCWSLDKVGPICRTVEDAALVLSELNGFDADDAGAARVGFTYNGGEDLSAMTVGYVPTWFEQGDDADRDALSVLRTLGVNVKEFDWPQADFESLRQIVLVEAAAAFSELTLSNADDQLGWQDEEAWPNTWRQARFFSAVDYVQIDRLRRRVMNDIAAAFEGFDALIGPHYAGGALLATNCTGHPQLALRAGFAQTPNRTLFDDPSEAAGAQTYRTPRGVSLWCNLFEEGKIIALGRALEAALGVAGQRPPGF
jgi:Asp-tRNA(Asn)/Glu-tRNA(Gln) amidotransferase A subunit family amidase